MKWFASYAKSIDCANIHGFLRRLWIHRLRRQIHGLRRSTDCAQHIHGMQQTPSSGLRELVDVGASSYILFVLPPRSPAMSSATRRQQTTYISVITDSRQSGTVLPVRVHFTAFVLQQSRFRWRLTTATRLRAINTQFNETRPRRCPILTHRVTRSQRIVAQQIH